MVVFRVWWHFKGNEFFQVAVFRGTLYEYGLSYVVAQVLRLHVCSPVGGVCFGPSDELSMLFYSALILL